MSADETFLSRWSRRKRGQAGGDDSPASSPAGGDDARAGRAPQSGAALASPPHAVARGAGRVADAPAQGAVPATEDGNAQGTERGAPLEPGSVEHERAPDAPRLPSIESLSPESDFTAFMQAGVDPSTRASALRRLFADPHFNRMDGLDIYIDDYGKPDPIPIAMLRAMNQARSLGLFDDTADSGDSGEPVREPATPAGSAVPHAEGEAIESAPAALAPQDAGVDQATASAEAPADASERGSS